MFMAPVPPAQTPEPHTTVYWSRLTTSALPGTPGVMRTFYLWKPWLTTVYSLTAPKDPPHCPYHFTRVDDLEYDEAFRHNFLGQMSSLLISYIYAGKEGVAAGVQLTKDQAQMYTMTSEAAPHVTLAIGPGHEARSLGPMVKRAMTLQWRPTASPELEVSTCGTMHRIAHQITDLAVAEIVQLPRDHGREYTDHPDTLNMFAQLDAVDQFTHGCGLL